jgi:hypothetical protein
MTIEALECVTAGTDMPLISSMTSVVDIGASPAPKETQTTQEILIKFTEVWLETVDKDLSQWPCLCSQSYFYQLGAFYFFCRVGPLHNHTLLIQPLEWSKHTLQDHAPIRRCLLCKLICAASPKGAQ